MNTDYSLSLLIHGLASVRALLRSYISNSADSDAIYEAEKLLVSVRLLLQEVNAFQKRHNTPIETPTLEEFLETRQGQDVLTRELRRHGNVPPSGGSES